MNLREQDRIQAIIRHPQYHKDYSSVQKQLKKIMPVRKGRKRTISLVSSPSTHSFGRKIMKVPIIETDAEQKVWKEVSRIEGALEEKWNIPMPLNPVDKKTWLKLFSLDPIVVAPFMHKQGNFPKSTVTRQTFNSRDFRLTFDHVTSVYPLERGRYLTLKIDIKAKKGEILEQVNDWIDLYRKHSRPPNERERTTTCDPWRVYDMRKQGKTRLKIAKEIFGFKENPSYSPNAKAKYEQVVTAYEKACDMIKAINPTT